MLFSSPVFLFLFLPVVLVAHYLAGPRLRNAVLLLASLLFYAWGETLFVLLMLLSIGVNYLLGLGLAAVRGDARARWVLALAVAFNLGLLFTFKYGTFFFDTAAAVLESIGVNVPQVPPRYLPLGISFFTFQALSYVVDVYRGEVEVQRRPLNVALYISLFPQLIAGPIVRYRDVARQLVERIVTVEGFATGIRRFVIGLGKKMLIANTLAVPADAIFALPDSELTPALSWLAVVCYSLQIYFDFSGYSDMAIGLGRMFGFRFLENFRYPYISKSIREFWRRWHISLSTWFRDYLYIPLGGSHASTGRVYSNLFLVFLLCGLWHGASWSFAVWGLFHGLFLVLERVGLTRLSVLRSPVVAHVYVILVFMVGWVFFRANNLDQAVVFLQAMAGHAAGSGIQHHVGMYLDRAVVLALVAGVIGSMPIAPWFDGQRRRLLQSSGSRAAGLEVAYATTHTVVMAIVFVSSVALVASDTYNPFIYFRF